MKRLKQMAVMVVTLCVVGCNGISIFAESKEIEKEAAYLSNNYEVECLVEDGVDLFNELRYNLIYLISIGLTCKNETAYIYTELNTYDAADLKITAKLQQKKNGTWTTIKTFKATATEDTYCYVDESYPITSGYYYRVVTDNYVDDGTDTENVTKTGNERYCN